MLHHCDLCHIDLDRITVRRGGQVLLQDVSMHIHCGQLTVLIGQNGAGKTTLIRALLGQIPHTGIIRHVDSRGLDIPHLRTGYVPQVLQFDREMPLTVQDYLAASVSSRPVWTGVSKKTQAKYRRCSGTWTPQAWKTGCSAAAQGASCSVCCLRSRLNPRRIFWCSTSL